MGPSVPRIASVRGGSSMTTCEVAGRFRAAKRQEIDRRPPTAAVSSTVSCDGFGECLGAQDPKKGEPLAGWGAWFGSEEHQALS